MTTWWCEAAWVDDAEGADPQPRGLRLREGVRLVTEGSRIVALSCDVAPAPSDSRLEGVTFPGLANTHSHAFHRALRGRTHADGGTFWTWREQMYAVAARLDPASYLALARATYAEMALAGYTAVGEFHYVHHRPDGTAYEDPNAMGAALVAAAADAGIRLTLLDTCYLAGGLGPDGHLPLAPEQRRFGDGTVAKWTERMTQRASQGASQGAFARDHVQLGAAIHSVRAVERADLAAVAKAAEGIPLHEHLSEQPAENDSCRAFYGRTPTELLAEAGALGPNTTVVHATHLTDTDITALGSARVTACFCPTTERDLADGIGPARALDDAGAHLALGSDQHAIIDPFEEARALESHERLASLQRGRFTPTDLVRTLSRHGYAALGWPDGGRLAVGALADFVAVQGDSVRTAGTRPEQLLYAAAPGDVTTVVVGGETVVSRGEHRLGAVREIGRMLAETIGQLH